MKYIIVCEGNETGRKYDRHLTRLTMDYGWHPDIEPRVFDSRFHANNTLRTLKADEMFYESPKVVEWTERTPTQNAIPWIVAAVAGAVAFVLFLRLICERCQ